MSRVLSCSCAWTDKLKLVAAESATVARYCCSASIEISAPTRLRTDTLQATETRQDLRTLLGTIICVRLCAYHITMSLAAT
jgi:hypothetical protein